MKTNYKNPIKFVLIDEFQKVIAIIDVPAGKQNIDLKVSLAIKEDSDADCVVISPFVDLTDTSKVVSFDAHIEIGGTTYTVSYKLLATVEY